MRFPKALIEKCLDCFSEKDWFILDNAIDGVTPEELKNPEYANHIASLLVHMGKLEYRYGANNQLELRVKGPSLKPVMFQESSRDSKATCFNLRFSMSEIPYWASRYEDNDNVAYKVGQSAKERGYLNKEEFLSICYWKSPRSRPMCEKKPSSYTFQFWWNYTVYCRALVSKAGVDMRTLDQALWQYSKEKQI